MENQIKAKIGRKRLGIASQLQGAIDPQKTIAKTTLNKAATAYRKKVMDAIYKGTCATTAVLFSDHEIKNIASRAKCAVSGFHRLAMLFHVGASRSYFDKFSGVADDVIFSLALNPAYNDMRVGDWRAMIDRMKEHIKTDTKTFTEHVASADVNWETFYNACKDCIDEVTWDQLLWIAANSICKKPDANITRIVIGTIDQATWTPVQHKLYTTLRAMYPAAVIVNADA